MAIFAKNLLKKIVLVIVTMSILLTFFATPSSYAKLTIEEGKYYYSGTTKGTYVATEGIFKWLLSALGDISDWLIGIMTLGFRMVFVGWTALIERLLTRTLESTVEKTDENGELLENSTDMMQLTSSTNNVTVEAIVYNMVPALDINFFKKGFDPWISGTGQELTCEKCKKSVRECCNDSDGSCKSTDDCGCKEADKCCAACRQYAAVLKAEADSSTAGKSIVDVLRTELAKWYYIIRLLSLAFMLIVLIAIGLKMAITNIASDKALYKRMLVDWVVGFIIIFAIHYVMLFVITANETLVNTVHETANELNKTRMENLSLMTLSEEEGKSDYSNQDLEIKVYEEIRTRAYDGKLTIGLPGMIMYMTLVYFAIRYTVVYVKRYLTIMILALMGPALGVSYAFQKVFHGKSPSLSKWLKEFIMNVIIQTVHAILYAIFISQALVLALDSLGGMLIGLVMMNYALKADKMFRKIFNMGGSGSLLDSTAEAGEPENMKQPFNAVKSYMKADATKELGKTLLNTPYAKAVKGLAKTIPAAAVTGVAVGAKKAADATGITDKVNEISEKFAERLDEKYHFDEMIDNADLAKDNRLPIRIIKRMRGVSANQAVNNDVFKALDEVRNAKTPEEHEKAVKNFYEAKQRRDRTISQPGVLRIAGARFTRAIDVRNTFNIGHSGDSGFKTLKAELNNGTGPVRSLFRGAKTSAKHAADNIRGIGVGIFGTKSVDPKTGAMVSNKNGMMYNMSLRGIGNLDDDDVAKLKDLAKTAGGGILGALGMFAGVGTFVANPKLGLTLLAGGAYKYHSVFGLRAPDIKDYRKRNRRYDFARFSNGAVNTMQKDIETQYGTEIKNISDAFMTESEGKIRRIGEDLRKLAEIIGKYTSRERLTRVKSALNPKALVERANKKREQMKGAPKRIFKGFKTGINIDLNFRPNYKGAKDRTITGPKMGSNGIRGDQEKVYFAPKNRRERRPITNLGVKYAKMMKQFEEDADDYFIPMANGMSRAEKDFNSRIKTLKTTAEDIEPLQIFYQNRRLEKRSRREEKLRRRRQIMLGLLEEKGLAQGQKGRIIGKDGSKQATNMPKITLGDINTAAILGKKNKRNNLQIKVDTINIAFEKAISKVANGKQIDLRSDAAYQEVLRQFEANLRQEGIFDKKQSAGLLFKKGKLRKAFEEKAGYTNMKIRTLDRFLERTMSKEDAENVKQALFGLMAEKGFGKDLSQITAAEVLDRMQDIASGKIIIDPKDGSVRFTRDGDREFKGERTYTEEEKKQLAIIEKYLGALKDENGEFGILVDSLRRDGRYLDERSKVSQGILDRMISEELSKVGMTGRQSQFKIASISDFDSRNITTTRLSPDFTRQVNAEIQATIASLMISKNGKLNIRDKKQYKEITDQLTERLRSQGILASYQDAEVLFKRGTLREIVQGQVNFVGNSQGGLEQFLKLTGVGPRVSISGASMQDFDKRNIRAGKLTEENVKIVNKEIQTAVAELVTTGEKIDATNAEQMARIVATLTLRLRDRGIIESFQDADVIFKAGKLEEVVDKQAEFIRSRPNGVNEFLLLAGTVQYLNIRKASKEDLEPMTPVAQKHNSEEIVKQIDIEIQATVVEAVARSSNGTIDISDKKEYKKVVEDLTERLIDKGILSTGQRASEIFKPGKLEEIIESQAKVASINPEETRAMAQDMAQESDDTRFVLELDTQDLSEDVADRYSPEDMIKLNTEIQAAIVDVAEGEKIDITDKKTRKEIIREVTERLTDAGLLKKGETIEDIVQPESLDRILEEETDLTNAKMSALDRFLDTALTEDEKSRVREVVAGLSDSERRFVSAEEIFEQAMAQVPMSDEERRERERMFAEEAEAMGYDYDSGSHQVEERKTLTDRQQETMDRYDQFLVEIYREQGMIYDPKTGTLSEDPEKKKSRRKIEETEQELETIGDTELTAADYTVIRAEMQDIIEEMAITGRLDLSSEKSRDEVMRRLSERAKSVGLIGQDERITDLFTRGSLEKAYKDEGTRAAIEVEARKRVLESEVGNSEGVMATIASLVEEKKKVDPEAIVDQVLFNPESDAPGLPHSRDKAVEVIGQIVGIGEDKKKRVEAVREINDRVQARQREVSAAEREEKLSVIEQYAESMREESEVSRRARSTTSADGDSSNDPQTSTPMGRKQKLEQIMDSKIDEIIQGGTSASGLLEDILKTTKPTSQEESLYMKQKVAIVRDYTVAVGKKVRKELNSGQIPMSAETFGAKGVLKKAEQIYGPDSVQAAEARRNLQRIQEEQIERITAERVRMSGITGSGNPPKKVNNNPRKKN